MAITSEKVLLKMNEIQSKGGEPIGHWHQLRRWLLEDEQIKEDFIEAVLNDSEMSTEQKQYWFSRWRVGCTCPLIDDKTMGINPYCVVHGKIATCQHGIPMGEECKECLKINLELHSPPKSNRQQHT